MGYIVHFKKNIVEDNLICKNNKDFLFWPNKKIELFSKKMNEKQNPYQGKVQNIMCHMIIESWKMLRPPIMTNCNW